MRKYLVLLLVAAVAFFAVPAMAQAPAAAPEKAVSFFAEVWYQTWWDQSDKDASNLVDKNSAKVASPWKGTWGIDTTVSRVGMRVKQGDFSGAVVLNANTSVAGDTSAHYREWWAEHDFGMLKLFFWPCLHNHISACLQYGTRRTG